MLNRFLILFTLLNFVSVAQDFPAQPRNYVTDDAQVLTDGQESQLNSKLRVFEDSTSTQIFVYTASSLNGQVMADLCQTIFHTWKIGQGKKNNGILIGIFVNDHKFRIHTGYGLEGVLPDVLTKRIQDENMRPFFKENDYYGGINSGVDQLIFYSKNEYVAQPSSYDDADLGFLIIYCIQLVLFLIECLILFRFFKGTIRARTTLFSIGIIAFLIPFIGIVVLILLSLIAYAMGRSANRSNGDQTYSSDSSWGSSSSGWSSSDSSSDSSFDGGGGGDSGGGGSDSSW